MELLLEGGAFFEGPRWHDGRWWVSDFYRYGVYTVDQDGREEKIVDVDGQPSGLGWLADGSLLIVAMASHQIMRYAHGKLTVHADLSGHVDTHLNDMVVDELGRAYVGSFGFDLMHGADPKPTQVHRVDRDGTITAVADDLWFPNAMMIDGDRLIVAETFGGGFTQFRIAANGDLTDRSSWGQVMERPRPGATLAEVLPTATFAPDGATLDAEGHIWAADGVGTRVCRVAPGGKIVEERQAPEGLAFYACMLGGADGRTLLCCAAPDFAEDARKAAREAKLFTTVVDVPKAGRP